MIPHPHIWRLLTAKDYGSSRSKHWGNYHGVDEDECVVCGKMRTVEYAITKKREDAERERAIRNLTPARLAYWRMRSLTSEGPILIGDGGSVSMLEFGTVFNGECLVLERGNDKFFGPKIIFRRGKQVQPQDLIGDRPANQIGQAHLDAANSRLKNSGFVPIDTNLEN